MWTRKGVLVRFFSMSPAEEFASVIGNLAEWAAVGLSLCALIFAAFAWNHSTTHHQHALEKTERERRALGPRFDVIPVRTIALMQLENLEAFSCGVEDGIGLIFRRDVDDDFLPLKSGTLARAWVGGNARKLRDSHLACKPLYLYIRNENADCQLRAVRCAEMESGMDFAMVKIRETSTIYTEKSSETAGWLLEIPFRYTQGLGLDLIMEIEAFSGHLDKQHYDLRFIREGADPVIYHAELRRISPTVVTPRDYGNWRPDPPA